MEIDDIRELIELLKDTDITELQIEKDGQKVKLRRGRFLSSMEMMRIEHGPAQPIAQLPAPGEAGEAAQLLKTVTAPLVGTFYRSSSPDVSPLVEAGAVVKKGQVLCIIEAMKLMNEIESDMDGVIARILVENGQPVEYGEPLFLIEPASV